MRYAVLAEPPTQGVYAGLEPRLQMFNTGKPVLYDDPEEAAAQTRACNADRNGWRYSVVPETWQKK